MPETHFSCSTLWQYPGMAFQTPGLTTGLLWMVRTFGRGSVLVEQPMLRRPSPMMMFLLAAGALLVEEAPP